MAQPDETRDVITAYCNAWKDGDLTTMLDLYHDDFSIHYFGTSPFAGTHTGKQAAMDALFEVSARSNRTLRDIEDILVGNDFGAILAIEELGPEKHATRRVLLYRVRDGKLHECWLYDEDQPFVDALWSQPSES